MTTTAYDESGYAKERAVDEADIKRRLECGPVDQSAIDHAAKLLAAVTLERDQLRAKLAECERVSVEIAEITGTLKADAQPALTAAYARGVAEEREACAQIADQHRARIKDHNPDTPREDEIAQGYGNAALNIAFAIRSRTGTAT